MQSPIGEPRTIRLRSTIEKLSTDLANYKKELVTIWLATTILAVAVFLSVVS